jgi:hypothetical protein
MFTVSSTNLPSQQAAPRFQAANKKKATENCTCVLKKQAFKPIFG